METKIVTLTLNPVTVEVKVKKNSSDHEIIEAAKKEVLKSLAVKFPGVTYTIGEENAITASNAQPGIIVETNDGEKGIITGVNAKTIDVTLTGHRGLRGPHGAFKKSSAPFEEARSKRQKWQIESNEWLEGDSGYLDVQGNLVPVVVGKSKGKKYKLYTINSEKGAHYTVEENQLRFLKDDEGK
ncbi:hypothetical protein [Niallia taxi]|uniref:hypothetical protein n=1 Tax=Niallia taxi TaxID=2499688 RepID=UPI0015F69D40|nr:hypothetical protein [Niallia taxi]